MGLVTLLAKHWRLCGDCATTVQPQTDGPGCHSIAIVQSNKYLQAPHSHAISHKDISAKMTSRVPSAEDRRRRRPFEGWLLLFGVK